jgi:hypothetical protein
LSKTERRLKVLRHTWAAALPGKVLAVYEQELAPNGFSTQ